MARPLEVFPENIEREDGKYPWRDWTDGRPWELEQGVDFETKVSSMRQTCKKLADRRGMKLRTASRQDGDKMFLIVQFEDQTRPAPGRRRARTRA